jgi:hypothetical protein
MPSTNTTYKVVSHVAGTSDTYQHDEIFESKEQAEKVASLLEERDEYNFSRIPRKWTVEENTTASSESTYFIAYSVTIDAYVITEDGHDTVSYTMRKHWAEFVKDFIPADTAEKVEVDGHLVWKVKVYDATVHGVRERARKLNLWMRYEDPTEHLNQR